MDKRRRLLLERRKMYKIELNGKKVWVKEITLLSAEEYEIAKKIIPSLGKQWWLRTPSVYDHAVAIVRNNGSVDLEGATVCDHYIHVRPVIKFSCRGNMPVEIGSKIEMAGKTWTVLPDKMALCDSFILEDDEISWYDRERYGVSGAKVIQRDRRRFNYGPCTRETFLNIDYGSNIFAKSELRSYVEMWLERRIDNEIIKVAEG